MMKVALRQSHAHNFKNSRVLIRCKFLPILLPDSQFQAIAWLESASTTPRCLTFLSRGNKRLKVVKLCFNFCILFNNITLLNHISFCIIEYIISSTLDRLLACSNFN